jgi:ATP-dependent DNA helicase RecQ
VDLQLPFSVIMLDEFQDINDDQFRFVEVLQEKSFSDKKEKDTKIIATGDDDQSIYEFQGGNITYIQKFKNRHNAEEIILGTNYRSTQKLIDFTDTFIQTVNPRIKAGRKLVSGRTDVGNILNLFGAKDSLVETWDCTGNYLP